MENNKEALYQWLCTHMAYQASTSLSQVANAVYDGGGGGDLNTQLCLVGPHNSGKSMTPQQLKWFLEIEQNQTVGVCVVNVRNNVATLAQTLPQQLADAYTTGDPSVVMLVVDDIDRAPYDVLQYVVTLLDEPHPSSPLPLITIFTCTSLAIPKEEECVLRALGRIIYYQ